MGCQEKIKERCKKVYANCTSYEGIVNTDSSLTDEGCLTIEETTQDIYDQLEHLNLSELGQKCLTYVEEDGKLYVNKVLLQLEQEICDLKTQLNTIQTTSVLNTVLVGIDFQCLQGDCDNQIVTLQDLLNSIITKICN